MKDGNFWAKVKAELETEMKISQAISMGAWVLTSPAWWLATEPSLRSRLNLVSKLDCRRGSRMSAARYRYVAMQCGISNRSSGRESEGS
jgi:hypothetical protein